MYMFVNEYLLRDVHKFKYQGTYVYQFKYLGAYALVSSQAI